MRQARLSKIVSTMPPMVPYIGPEAQERARGRAFIARLGANESLFGPSPKAIAAMQAAAEDCWKYSDPENYDLRVAIAALHGVTPAHVVIGEGIDGLLGLAVRIAADAEYTGHHVGRRLSHVQLPRGATKRPAHQGAVPRRSRRSRRIADGRQSA